MADNNPFKTILAWVTGLGSIALFLLIMLILFGNLSGNTGFDDSTSTLTITNESISWVMQLVLLYVGIILLGVQ